MGERYVVKYVGMWDRYGKQEPVKINGYYSKKQPNYSWSFTDDINESKM